MALHACLSGADAVGLMFYPGSKRYINIDQARSVCSVLTPLVASVGVFVEPDPKFVNEMVKQLGLIYLQFHGNESPEFCESFSIPYIKAISVKDGIDLSEIDQRYESASAILLDTDSATELGGTGKTFDWDKSKYQRKRPIFLAGGLNPSNVGTAIEVAMPYGVDVSSGVEENGKKNAVLITKFCQSVLNISS